MTGIASAGKRHEFIQFHPPPINQNPGALDSLISGMIKQARAIAGSRLVPRPIRRSAPSFQEQCIRDNDVDLVWFLTPAARPVSVPYIATVWDLEHRKQPYFPEVSTTGWTWEEREHNYLTLLPRAARIITGTEEGKKEIISFYGVRPENVRVVRFPVPDRDDQLADGDRCAVLRKYGLNNPFVIYPAQFWPHKNHVNLLLALRLLNQNSDQPLELVLTGADRGNLAYVQHIITELGLSTRVHALGYVSQKDLAGLYLNAVALVYPSFFGPDNFPPLEALASGCPVALSRLEGASHGLEDAVMTFDPTDPASIAETIQTLRTNAGRRADLVRRGMALIAGRTPQAYVEEICDLLDEFEPLRRCWGKRYVHP